MIDSHLAQLVVVAQSLVVPLVYEVFARSRVSRIADGNRLNPELERFYQGMRTKWAMKAISDD